MNKNIVLHLTLLEDVGPSIIYQLVDAVGFEHLSVVYQYTVADFVRCGISQAKSEILVAGLADMSILTQELDLIAKYHVTVITHWCPEYSQLLREIHILPVVLYCLGNVDLLTRPKMIACVGARKAHSYVLEVLQHVVVPLIQQSWVVVSGGALGADTYAHQVALQHGGKTIAVIGSGICFAYPPQNKKLFAEIIASGGLVVTPFGMKMQPLPICFPMRNRIISGLSLGCIVLQAASKSGALITAQQALDQGREVFAIPGSIFDPLSAGCHSLIQQGAKLTVCAQDVLAELDPAYQQPVDDQMELFQEQPSAMVSASQKLDPVSRQIVQSLVVPMTADRLMDKMQIDMAQLQSVLFDLSLEGLIRQDDMGFWVRV